MTAMTDDTRVNLNIKVPLSLYNELSAHMAAIDSRMTPFVKTLIVTALREAAAEPAAPV